MTIARARWLAAAALFCVAGHAATAQPTQLGPEISLTPRGYCPGLAGRADGTFAVAWIGFLLPDRVSMTVQAGALGGGFSPPHMVNVEAEAITGDTSIAATAAGYSVVWQVAQADRFPHFALATNLTGVPLGEAQDLDRQSLGVSPRPAGGFVSHWQEPFGKAVYVQLVDAAGHETSPPVKQLARNVVWSGVAHRPGGGFVLYWNEQKLTSPNRNAGIGARRFDPLGRPVGAAFRLVPPGGAPMTSDLFRLAVGMDGTLAAAWAFRPAEDETGRQGLRVRAFDGRGTPLGPTHELIGGAARSDRWFVPGGLAVDALGRVRSALSLRDPPAAGHEPEG